MSDPRKILYTAEATVEGGREGHGRTSDGRLEVDLDVPTEMGGSGGPGTNPEQLFAKAKGAYVIGTARAAQHELVTELGVDEAIVHTQQDVGETVRDVDVVLDLVGGETGLRSLPVLREGGLLITVPSSSDVEPLRRAARDRVRVTGILVEPDRTGMEAIAALVEDGALRVHVAEAFPLAQAARAHELGESGHAGGNSSCPSTDQHFEPIAAR
jgi:NADPH:quinone reductase-like Zn-dependent oxidoreductase